MWGERGSASEWEPTTNSETDGIGGWDNRKRREQLPNFPNRKNQVRKPGSHFRYPSCAWGDLNSHALTGTGT